MKWVSLFLTMLPFLWSDDFPPRPIWNLGLASLCDHNPFKEGLPTNYTTSPSLPSLDPKKYISHVKMNDLVWVQMAQLPRFVKSVLPSIKKNFILVLSDGDEGFPESFQDKINIQELLNDYRILHIFTQNCTFYHPKVSSIPIGVDFHSMAHEKGAFGEAQTSPSDQAKNLMALLQTLPPTSLRKKKALIEFHLSNKETPLGESRTTIFKKIESSPVIDILPGRLPRTQIWQKKGEYAFSISPQGNGLDCHRTWEDLLLGCIVIVKTSTLDPLYKGLPVVIIHDWDEITEENFDRWFEQYKHAFTYPEYRKRLTNTYWLQKMRSHRVILDGI